MTLTRAMRAFEQALLVFADESTPANFARYRLASAVLALAQNAERAAHPSARRHLTPRRNP
jgi:hypothetical protein